jgi:RNA polymerase sigma-70 factor (ECF subfamily)
MSETDHSNLKSNEALIQGCIRGDRACQNQLYKKYGAKMLTLCMRYVNTKEDAEDILQEGFVQVFTRIKQVKTSETLEAWIRKIFINRALQKLRDKKNRFSLIDIDSLPDTQIINNSAEGEIDAKFLIRCIQNLPLTSRLVFNLYVFEGFKHREIAQMLKISEGTSKSNLFDARSNLKKQLKEYNLFFLENAANE